VIAVDFISVDEKQSWWQIIGERRQIGAILIKKAG
jgi:hypothetical protein